MKKAILIFILLILAAGACFYFGWINVDPGTFSLAHSSVTGTVDYPLESGTLHWLWQKLVPKSFHLYTFKKEPYTAEIEILFHLPGSEELKEYGSFSLEGVQLVEYRIDYNTARSLMENGIIERFEHYLENGFQSQAEDVVTQYILNKLADYSLLTEEFDYGAIRELKKDLDEAASEYAKQFNLRDLISRTTFTQIPHVETYRKALSSYFEYMEYLNRVKTEDIKRESEYRRMEEEDDLEIARLRKYGELISQYPELLKYFYIQKFGDKTRVLVLPQDESSGFPRMLEPSGPRPEKEFIPLEPHYEEQPPPEREEQEQSFEGQEETQQESTTEEANDRWYRYLKFWEYIKK
jgi:hypothetical protein